MDQKHLKSNDKELIKKAMLKHEEIFKEQVQELHRLYRKQKLLMNKSNTEINENQVVIEESEIQLTLGPSIYKSGQKRSSSGESLCSSNSTGSSQILNKEASIQENSTWEFARSSSKSIKMNLGDEVIRQQHPPWLFQALSLKLT